MPRGNIRSQMGYSTDDFLAAKWLMHEGVSTQSNPRNLSVSYRHGVATLEDLVGPKS